MGSKVGMKKLYSSYSTKKCPKCGDIVRGGWASFDLIKCTACMNTYNWGSWKNISGSYEESDFLSSRDGPKLLLHELRPFWNIKMKDVYSYSGFPFQIFDQIIFNFDLEDYAQQKVGGVIAGYLELMHFFRNNTKKLSVSIFVHPTKADWVVTISYHYRDSYSPLITEEPRSNYKLIIDKRMTMVD